MRRLREPRPEEVPAALDRRQILGAVAGWIAVGLSGAGCPGGGPESPLKPGQIAVPLEDLRPGVRTVVVVAGNPVELVRSGDAVTARMLRCTHLGCVVRWRQAEHAYVCPCHEGRYDEAGNVLAGPPPLPLRSVPVLVAGGRAVVG